MKRGVFSPMFSTTFLNNQSLEKTRRLCGVCRAWSSGAAHMLGYTGKTLVWWEIGEKGPYSLHFSRVSCLFLLGSCGCKSDLEKGTPSG